MFIPGTLCLRNQERSSEVRQAASPLSIFSLWPVFPGFLSSVLTASFWCFALHLNTQGLLLLLCPGVRRHRPLPITTDSSFIFCSPVLTSWTWPSKVSISSGLIQGIKSTGCPRNSQSWVLVSVCSQRMSFRLSPYLNSPLLRESPNSDSSTIFLAELFPPLNIL